MGALVVQFRSTRYHPFVYWTAVAMIAVIGTRAAGAAELWQDCVNSLQWSHVSSPAEQKPGAFSASTSPSIGGETRRRLKGCLQDLTVEGVKGHVTGMADHE